MESTPQVIIKSKATFENPLTPECYMRSSSIKQPHTSTIQLLSEQSSKCSLTYKTSEYADSSTKCTRTSTHKRSPCPRSAKLFQPDLERAAELKAKEYSQQKDTEENLEDEDKLNEEGQAITQRLTRSQG